MSRLTPSLTSGTKAPGRPDAASFPDMTVPRSRAAKKEVGTAIASTLLKVCISNQGFTIQPRGHDEPDHQERMIQARVERMELLLVGVQALIEERGARYKEHVEKQHA